MKKLLLSLGVILLLSACASGVKLNEVPVEDKSGSKVSVAPAPVMPAPVTASSANEAKSAVVPVDSAASTNLSAGPSGNVAKVIFFDYDSYVVKSEFQTTIEAHAQFLKANPRAKVSLEGHTDERGGREYNLALGQKRADAVRQSLSLLGVQESQVESVSFGKEKPAAQGSDESAFAKNRRAEFFYR
ncbi:MAG: peptidoglycan-associated lipoprotein Pal [Betaproteobacteria bacterium]|nr:peptidoglycan-associated lipoprotein Pal [Betaproteobacteria bacterium]